MKPKSKAFSFRITQSNLDEVEKLAVKKQCDRSKILNETLAIRLKHLAANTETEQKISQYIDVFSKHFLFTQRSFNDLNQLIKIAHILKTQPIDLETKKHLEDLLKQVQSIEKSSLVILRNLSKIIEILENKSS